MIFAGDFVPGSTRPLVDHKTTDYIVANLEGPVCSGHLVPINKVGPHLRNDEFDIEGKWAFALANNHMMDFGASGLKATRDFLERKDFSFAGAGDDLAMARAPMRLREGDKIVSIVSCCERQFGITLDSHPGVAEKGFWLLDTIKLEKAKGADFVVVSCHAACEFSYFPSPNIRDFYRLLIDNGADVVHGHHAHVPQGYEIYKGKPIFYGLGNFVVDVDSGWRHRKNARWSLVGYVNFACKPLSCRVEPYGDVPRYIDTYMSLINAPFRDESLYASVWQSIAINMFNEIYKGRPGLSHMKLFSKASFSSRVKTFLKLAYNTFLMTDVRRLAIQKSEELSTWHYFGCESHRDLIDTALGVLTGAIPDLRTVQSESIIKEIDGLQ